MSAAKKKKKKKDIAEAPAAKAVESPVEGENGWQPEQVFQGESTVVESTDLVGTLQAQLEAARSQVSRITSEFANFRKRSNEQKAKTLMYAIEAMVVELLPILDDFDRAVSHMEDESADPQEVFDGVKLIWRRLTKVLAQRGVVEFQALGERFDPFLHEAMQIREIEGMPPGTVVQEFEKGYMYHDRLLRATKVLVTPLAPVEAPVEEEPEAEQSRGKKGRKKDKPELAETIRELPADVEGKVVLDPELDVEETPPPLAETPEVGSGDEEDFIIDEESGELTTPTEEPLSGDEWVLEEGALGEEDGDELFSDEKTNPEASPIE